MVRTWTLSLLVVLCVPRVAFSQEDFEAGDEEFDADSGPEFGVRVGYGVGSGPLASEFQIEERMAGALPMGIDLGYRLSERWLIGGYGEYAVGITSDSAPTECRDCTFTWVHLALFLHYRLLSLERGDVWAGIGTGRQLITGSISQEERRQGEPFLQKRTQSFSGPEYLHLDFGATYRPTEEIGFGPYTSFSIGVFDRAKETCEDEDSCIPDQLDVAQGAHLWFATGVRVVFLP